ncbi:hypothetical protein [Pseudomonas sp. Marseille-QA0892]
MKIRGTIGQWPVDLTIELDDHELSRIGALAGSPSTRSEQPATQRSAPVPTAQDPCWEAAQDLLRQAGQMDGPALAEALQALTGSAAAAKKLLVRLRHSADVRLESGPHVQIYHWQLNGQ